MTVIREFLAAYPVEGATLLLLLALFFGSLVLMLVARDWPWKIFNDTRVEFPEPTEAERKALNALIQDARAREVFLQMKRASGSVVVFPRKDRRQ